MLLFWIVFVLLLVPRLDRLTEAVPVVPIPIPINVVVLALPTMLQFLTVLLVAPSVPFDCSQTTADVAPVFASVIVRLRSVPVPPIEPSIVTRSAALSRIKPPDGAVVLVINRALVFV